MLIRTGSTPVITSRPSRRLAKTRTQFVCGLKGENRPARKPKWKVPMGGIRLPVFTTHCPWSVALADRKTSAWLSTYWVVKDLGVMPPGRQDPQLLDAFAIIANEHNRILTEELENPTRG